MRVCYYQVCGMWFYYNLLMCNSVFWGGLTMYFLVFVLVGT